jgi:hypothetical protein
MRSRILLPVLLLVGLVFDAHAIDFKLRKFRVENLDGANVDLYFAHESNRVFFRPPPGWTWEDSAASFEASAPAPRGGRLKIVSMEPAADIGLPGDAQRNEAFQKLALGSLTSEALMPQVLDVQVAQLGGRELPCTRVTISYRSGSQERIVTLCYAVFRPNLWLKFSVDAAKVDFASASAEAFHSLEGFTEMPGEAPVTAAPAAAAPAIRASL